MFLLTRPISCVHKKRIHKNAERWMLCKSQKSPCPLGKKAWYMYRWDLHICTRGLRTKSHQKEERWMQAGIELSAFAIQHESPKKRIARALFFCWHRRDACTVWTSPWHTNESCHTSMGHVTHEWVMLHMRESCNTWLSHVTHVTHEWIVSHMNTWMNRVTQEGVISYVNELCHIWMSHVTWTSHHITPEWVRSYADESCHK